MKKVLVLLVGLSLVLLVGFGCSNKEMEAENLALKTQVETLTTANGELQAKVDELTRQWEELTSAKAACDQELAALKAGTVPAEAAPAK